MNLNRLRDFLNIFIRVMFTSVIFVSSFKSKHDKMNVVDQKYRLNMVLCAYL